MATYFRLASAYGKIVANFDGIMKTPWAQLAWVQFGTPGVELNELLVAKIDIWSCETFFQNNVSVYLYDLRNFDVNNIMTK